MGAQPPPPPILSPITTSQGLLTPAWSQWFVQTLYAQVKSGLVTVDMIEAALGYVPYDKANPNKFISGISQFLVDQALGYTPEPALGNPTIDGMALISTALGKRSWGSAGGGSGCTRTTLNFTSGSLAVAADEIDTVPTGADSFLFLSMTVSIPCRVRVYATAAFAAADRTRPSSQDPVGNFGMYLEMVFIPGVPTWTMAPIPVAVNQDVVENQNVYMTIQNLSPTTTTITITASLLKME